MKSQTLIEKLKILEASDLYPFHMPGHKRQIEVSLNPYKMDITEIEGFDNLHHPTEVLKEVQDKWAKLYGAPNAYLLINGSSGGILSAISAATRAGDEVLIARNSHKSVYHAALLNRLKVHYLYPKQLRLNINASISPEEVEEQFKLYPQIKCVVITSPTYDGVLSDIKEIAKIVHDRGAVLIVDAAHGAHLGLFEEFEENNGVQYADIVILSIHKTLPSPTQSAILIHNNCKISKERLSFYLNVYETSSPSYVMMAAMEKCMDYCLPTDENKARVREYNCNLMKFYKETEDLKVLQVFHHKEEENLFKKDATKILISTQTAKDYSGEDLMEELRLKFHIECEMAAVNYVIALSSFMDTKEGLDRLSNALLKIDKDLHYGNDESISCSLYAEKEKLYDLYEVIDEESEARTLKEAEGCVSTEFCYLYPPGIPIVAPGEVIPEDFARNIEEAKKKNMAVEGLSDYSCKTIKVLKYM